MNTQHLHVHKRLPARKTNILNAQLSRICGSLHISQPSSKKNVISCIHRGVIIMCFWDVLPYHLVERPTISSE
jgi:hypothetical protein